MPLLGLLDVTLAFIAVAVVRDDKRLNMVLTVTWAIVAAYSFGIRP